MKIGKDVTISPRAVIYNEENLVIGDHVRIDDFCILSCGGGLVIGSYVHLAPYSNYHAGAGIRIGDFVGISAHCAFYSTSDDYSGEAMFSPMIPDKFKKVHRAPISIGRHTLIGHAVTVLPGVTIGEGVAIGAHSFIASNLKSWTIYAGTPVKYVKNRSRNLLNLEREFLNG